MGQIQQSFNQLTSNFARATVAKKFLNIEKANQELNEKYASEMKNIKTQLTPEQVSKAGSEEIAAEAEYQSRHPEEEAPEVREEQIRKAERELVESQLYETAAAQANTNKGAAITSKRNNKAASKKMRNTLAQAMKAGEVKIAGGKHNGNKNN